MLAKAFKPHAHAHANAHTHTHTHAVFTVGKFEVDQASKKDSCMYVCMYDTCAKLSLT